MTVAVIHMDNLEQLGQYDPESWTYEITVLIYAFVMGIGMVLRGLLMPLYV
jgi:hypothetical protein